MTILRKLLALPLLATLAQPCLAIPINPQANPLDRRTYDQEKCQPPLSTGLLDPDLPLGQTDRTISQEHLTLPSLWWTRDEFAARSSLGKKLIDSWLICPASLNAPQHVQMVLNAQIWSLLEYFERYEFLHLFGTVTSNSGYNLWLYSDENPVLAAYTCDYHAVSTKLPCQLQLNQSFSGKRGDADLPKGK
jgi:hypothetical protein